MCRFSRYGKPPRKKMDDFINAYEGHIDGKWEVAVKAGSYVMLFSHIMYKESKVTIC